jgi:hypothetical protein
MHFRVPAFFALLLGTAQAQLTERPGGSEDNPIDTPRDLSGLSLKNPRIRILHTTDASLPGGSMWLQERDPWLAYQWGRSLFQREFRERDGVYGDAGKLDGPLLPDGATRMQTRSHVNSCAACHATPYRDAGAGGTIAKNGGSGRNTPHLYGGGLIEMIGQQLRMEIIRAADADGSGWISAAEAREKRCLIRPLTNGGDLMDFGRFDDTDGDGWPDLNGIVHPVFVDEDGLRMPAARNLTTPGVAGFRVDVQVFGFAHLRAPHRPPLPSTVRAFAANTFDMHIGLQPCDPGGLEDDDGDGFSRPTNAGCPQPATITARDRGRVLTKTGVSTEDPDRDGWCHEISEGEMDVFEWYALNHPAPGRGEITDAVRRGEQHFHSAGCASCHTPDWELKTGSGYAGDRRFFDLEVGWQPERARLEGKLRMLGNKRAGFRVAGIFSDFRWHDMGEEFAQMQYDGTVVRLWRTTPLWGAADSAPYGHDGASPSLDTVIRRHGGEASAAREAFVALPAEARQDVIAFLQSMVLYSTDQVPCDIDGDGRIAEHFIVAGMDTGTERLNPEWLFCTPGRIEGPVKNPRGETVVSFALTNVRPAYGLNLPLLKDRDGDGFPDKMDAAPDEAGFRDGVK